VCKTTCARSNHIRVTAMKNNAFISATSDRVLRFSRLLVYWDVTLLQWASGRHRFEGMYCLHSQKKSFSSTLPLIMRQRVSLKLHDAVSCPRGTGIRNSRTACGLSRYSDTDPPQQQCSHGYFFLSHQSVPTFLF